MKWNVGTKIGAGFGLALAILMAIGFVAYQSSVKQTDTAEWVDHTHLVLQNLEGVLSTMKDAETGQRGFVLAGEERYLEPYLSAQAAIGQKLKSLRELTKDNPNQQRRLDALEPLIDGKDGKFAELQETIDLRRDKAKGFDAALQVVLTDKGKNAMDQIRKIIGDMESEENTLLKTRSDEAQASARNAKSTIVFGTLAAFVFMAVAGIVITRNIARPLLAITGAAERMASGDLTVNLATDHRADEIGLLTKTFGRMSDNLREQIRGLVEGANVLGSAASEIVASTAQLSSSATESATAVSETTTTVEEVRQTAQMASQKAKAVSDSAQKVAQISQSGRKSTEDATTGMNRIRQQMDSIAESMGRLSEQSQTIGQIIATVEDLAAQSNLLAVNAAIEAAKAGEHGKGFGVVAQEVKSLAEQSRQATNQVRTILTDIQKATTSAVLATEQGAKAVETGGKQTEAAGESIQSLSGSVTEAAQAATQIAASSQQQLVGMDQVAVAMENIKQASTQNVASARQLETAARNLGDLGQRLKQMVERYKV
ncbi:MAG: CHASE3 domain-containing protein [Chthoniobacter sp.]|nr:CHASE3 domain-containing protein [Chthoniobacter sp.]